MTTEKEIEELKKKNKSILLQGMKRINISELQGQDRMSLSLKIDPDKFLKLIYKI